MKAKGSKSMRVATIFTGVAACTGGLAQAANAQDTTHTPVHHAAFPAARSTGSIRQVSDCHDLGIIGTSNWQTDATYGPVGGGFSVCYGDKGTWQSPPGTGLSAECGGNNRGWLYGGKNDSPVVFDFGVGKTYAFLGWSHFLAVHISGWTGTDECPAPIHNQ